MILAANWITHVKLFRSSCNVIVRNLPSSIPHETSTIRLLQEHYKLAG